MMNAVIRTGGKQYYITPGDTLEVDRLVGEVGDSLTLDEVLLVTEGEAVSVGQPTVSGASVTAKITGQYRGNKVMVFRYRPKKRIRVRRGHRQALTRLQIEAINV
jgi:large subunit ribosomal protein L21